MKIFGETRNNASHLSLYKDLAATPAPVRLSFCSVCKRESLQAMWMRIKSNGMKVNVYRCFKCDRYFEGRYILDESLPVYRDGRNDTSCERCGSGGGVERHHWAPYHLFKDADSWPTSWLCCTCHQEWHRIVTPNMSAKKADE